MLIPGFPTFEPIKLEHRAEIERYFTQHPPACSEYTFTNLFAWSSAWRYQISKYADGYLVLKQMQHGASFLQPLVTTRPLAAAQACFDYLRAHGEAAPVIERVGEDFIQCLGADGNALTIAPDRDNFDYLYDVQELIELKGSKFHAKRNHLNTFMQQQTYSYSRLTPEITRRCLRFAHEWCEEKECEKDEGLSQETCAVFRMLYHFAELRTEGGIIEIDGEIAALTLGERLNPDTLVIHVEKAKGGVRGLYQAINWEFLRHEGADCAWVNREQDLGIPGLRKAKESYNPVALVKKYTLRPRP